MRLLSVGIAAVVALGATLSQTVWANADLVLPLVRGHADGIFSGEPILDAPFSAVATTSVRGKLGDGSPIQQTSTAHYYRDRAGQLRVEQLVTGGQPRVTIQADSKALVYLLATDKQSVSPGPRHAADTAVGGGRSFALTIDRLRFLTFRPTLSEVTATGEPLGSRTIEGLEAVGWRFTSSTDGQTYERWESPALGLLVSATHVDDRMGTIEYRMTNIRRSDPAPELFELPADRRMSTSEPCWIELVPAANPRHKSGCEGSR
ncbi:MAG: hypothetical protein M3541_12035 [Acidobacteriota bacterium]|nr:hypothetical protein [Acidobacteriota bacterium]MDQ3419490.1 hypothetical protein [Acidobacteriota bacterium]